MRNRLGRNFELTKATLHSVFSSCRSNDLLVMLNKKTALKCAFGQFLSSLTTLKSLSSALPADVVAFLVWKDCGDRTKVHQSTCPPVSCPGMACDLRLASGCGEPCSMSFSEGLSRRCSGGTTYSIVQKERKRILTNFLAFHGLSKKFPCLFCKLSRHLFFYSSRTFKQ